MAVVVDDTCGVHDLTLTPCSQQTFDLLYPEFERRLPPVVLREPRDDLAPHGVDPDRIATTLNIFMNVWAEREGELHIDPPTSRRRPLRAGGPDADLVVGLTACSAEKSNNGVCKPIDWQVQRSTGRPVRHRLGSRGAAPAGRVPAPTRGSRPTC